MIKKIITITAFFIVMSSFSQKNNISPYSFFGIGQINESQTVTEHSMAIGTALNSTYKMYFSNPASLGSLRFTTYTLALKNTFTKIDDGFNTQSTSSVGLSYLALGIPIGKKAGIAFGLQPFSTVGYHITNKAENPNIDNELYTSIYEGYGKTNRVFLNYGQKLPYKTNVGLEMSYTFGSLERTILSRNEEQLDRLATYYKTDTSVGGFAMKFGVQNSFKITEKLDLKSGITLLLENKLDYKGDESLTSVANSPNPAIIIPKDDIFNRAFIGTITMPLKTSLSIGVGNSSKWFAGIAYSFQDATTFSDNFTQKENFASYTKSNNIAFGGFYTPKAESITNYWNRVTYSAGIHLKETGLQIKNTAIKDFGMSFGVSLPSKRQLSNINLGFDLGKRGEINNNGLIKENYYNFRLSLSLNDKWFRKRKID